VVRDILVDHGRITIFSSPRVAARETHGTGCTLSAAITAFLAGGVPLIDAIRQARTFVHRALATARPTGIHVPLNLLPPDRHRT
jgi:hydroxymethylpyrimidine/phosphomethylpyrimidine kinase